MVGVFQRKGSNNNWSKHPILSMGRLRNIFKWQYCY